MSPKIKLSIAQFFGRLLLDIRLVKENWILNMANLKSFILRYFDVFAATCALGIGIGLERTQFAALAELMVQSKWIATESIGLLAGFHLAGYIVGCIHQTTLKSEIQSLTMIRLGLFVCVVSFFVEPIITIMGWQILWRMLAGWGAAHLVTGLPGFATRNLDGIERRRSTAFIFAGGGISALIAAVLVSAISSPSPLNSWILTGVVSVFFGLPILSSVNAGINEELAGYRTREKLDENLAKPSQSSDFGWTAGLYFLAITTFLFGAAQVSVITYFPIFISTKFNLTSAVSASFFSMFGLGYMVGAIVAGFMPKKWSTDSILIASAFVGVTGSFLTVLGFNVYIATIGCFLFAFWNGSMIGLIVARLRELVGQLATRKAWAIFSFLLSIGYIIYTFASSYLTKYSISTVIWVGFALTAAQLFTMLIAATEFKKQINSPFA